MGTTIQNAGADLTAALTNLTTSTATDLGLIATALSAAQQPNGSVSAADVETAVTGINAVTAQLNAAAAALPGGTPAPAASAQSIRSKT